MQDNRKLAERKQAREQAMEQASKHEFVSFVLDHECDRLHFLNSLFDLLQTMAVTWICKPRKSFAHDVAFVRVSVTSAAEGKLEQRVT